MSPLAPNPANVVPQEGIRNFDAVSNKPLMDVPKCMARAECGHDLRVQAADEGYLRPRFLSLQCAEVLQS